MNINQYPWGSLLVHSSSHVWGYCLPIYCLSVQKEHTNFVLTHCILLRSWGLGIFLFNSYLVLKMIMKLKYIFGSLSFLFSFRILLLNLCKCIPISCLCHTTCIPYCLSSTRKSLNISKDKSTLNDTQQHKLE